MEQAFNEWMRRYIDEPERFSREWQDVMEFTKSEEFGKEPTYGHSCAAYLRELMQQRQALDASDVT